MVARESGARTNNLVKLLSDSAMAFAVVQERDCFPAHPVNGLTKIRLYSAFSLHLAAEDDVGSVRVIR